MSTRLITLCFDAGDPLRLARFWAAALEWEIDNEDDEEIGLVPCDGTPFEILFLPVPEPSKSKSRIHLDLVSDSPGHQTAMVDRFLELGARRVDIGQPAERDWEVLADPEGNEFCVVLRGDFFATSGLIGAVVFEPAEPSIAGFWSAATGWPIVYDGADGTAIRSPDGRGPFLTFGPSPDEDKTAKNRLHLDIAPPIEGDQATEVERLGALGAQQIDIGQGDVSWVVLADPDGNEFCVLRPR